MAQLSNSNSNSDKQNIAEVKKITGISDFQNITGKEVETISSLFHDKKITGNQFNSVIKNFPTAFYDGQKELVKTLRDIVENAGSMQKDGIKAVANSLDNQDKILLSLAESIETEQGRIELARITIELARLKIEVSKLINDAVKNNNSFWGKKFMVASALIAIVAGLVLEKNNES